MRYRTLGPTGVQVSSLALGAMNFGAVGRTNQDDATAIVDAALDAGINLSTPPTSTVPASPRRWSARPSPAGATTW